MTGRGAASSTLWSNLNSVCSSEQPVKNKGSSLAWLLNNSGTSATVQRHYRLPAAY